MVLSETTQWLIDNCPPGCEKHQVHGCWECWEMERCDNPNCGEQYPAGGKREHICAFGDTR